MNKFLIIFILFPVVAFGQKVSPKKAYVTAKQFNSEAAYRKAIAVLTPRVEESVSVQPLMKLELAKAYKAIRMPDSALFYLDNQVMSYKKSMEEVSVLKSELQKTKEVYNQLMQASDSLIRIKYFSDVKVLLDKAAEIDTGNYRSFLDMARLVQAQGNVVEAEKRYKKALTKYFDNDAQRSLVWIYLGSLARDARQFHIALTRYQKALELDPGRKMAEKGLANAYFKNRMFSQSAQVLTDYLANYPDDAGAWNQRGESYFYQKKYLMAIEDLSEALKRDGSLVGAYDYKAQAFYYLAAYDSAEFYFSFLNNMFDGNFYTMNALGNCAYAQLKYDTALIWYEAALRINKNERMLFNAGLASFKLERNEKALAFFEQALALNNNLPLYHIAEVKALVSVNKLTEAKKRLDNAIANNRFIADYYLLRAEIWDKLNKPDNAASDRAIANKLKGTPIRWEPQF